jgi:hypothetical protein
VKREKELPPGLVRAGSTRPRASGPHNVRTTASFLLLPPSRVLSTYLSEAPQLPALGETDAGLQEEGRLWPLAWGEAEAAGREVRRMARVDQHRCRGGCSQRRRCRGRARLVKRTARSRARVSGARPLEHDRRCVHPPDGEEHDAIKHERRKEGQKCRLTHQ